VFCATFYLPIPSPFYRYNRHHSKSRRTRRTIVVLVAGHFPTPMNHRKIGAKEAHRSLEWGKFRFFETPIQKARMELLVILSAMQIDRGDRYEISVLGEKICQRASVALVPCVTMQLGEFLKRLHVIFALCSHSRACQRKQSQCSR
jgi:hypothetical protein